MNRAPLLSTGVALAIGVAIAGIVACGGAPGKSAKFARSDAAVPGGVQALLNGWQPEQKCRRDATLTSALSVSESAGEGVRNA